MTPKKELYLSVRDRIGTVTGIEYIDINRNQFGPGKENYPQYYTASLIRITGITWETMVEQLQEGLATVEVILYTLDGFADQLFGTMDQDDGLTEIDLIDDITDKLQFLEGSSFRPLQQIDEGSIDTDIEGMMAYRMTFNCQVYRKTASRYTKVQNPFKQ
ncbi:MULTISPECIES: hypothetical protein [Sphingobacterium]|uniref:hypothetical protein n=1 Tax=Sphingobacterium TaxID=28453 RepID=UPI00257A9AD9|nr:MULTISPECIES: hypothetical protein [Sphingobacterium]